MRLSPIHRKGVSLLALILIAESVTLSNAVKVWSNFQTDYQNFVDEDARRNTAKTAGLFKRFSNSLAKRSECLSSEDPETCSSSGFLPSLKKLKLPSKNNNNNNNKSTESCCASCYQCMEPTRALRDCANIPRGGHVHHHAAETLAEAVAQDAGVTPYGIPLHLWKIIFQAILTTINVACWLLPLKSKKISENKLGLSLANAFSGGVFLSLAFGHLIPECVHGFSDYPEAVPYMLVLGGYLLIFFVEKVAFDAHDILHEMEHGSGHSHGTEEKAHNGVVENTQGTGRSAVILLGALAVHSILEMMALGLADTFGDCALLTLSIALHQVRLELCLSCVNCRLTIHHYLLLPVFYSPTACRVHRSSRSIPKVWNAKESNNSVPFRV
jgi:ZIP Zinc transporter